MEKDSLAIAINIYAKSEVGGELLGLYAACRDGNLVNAKRFTHGMSTRDLEVGLIGAYQGGNKEVIDYMKELISEQSL